MGSATTAAEYFDRYSAAFEQDALIQGSWHTEEDGRHLACALGTIGDNVNGPSDCPTQIMPRWLARMYPWLFDSQDFADARAWGLDMAAELKRLDGKVPFTVVYDWHGNVSTVMGIEAAVMRNRDTAPHEALRALHLRALTGDRATADEWRPVLKTADADADAYADAYAAADAYADAYAYAAAYAYAYAYAAAYAYADTDTRRKAINRLAVGLVECLRRVPSEA